jgi:hypothetical protein
MYNELYIERNGKIIPIPHYNQLNMNLTFRESFMSEPVCVAITEATNIVPVSSVLLLDTCGCKVSEYKLQQTDWRVSLPSVRVSTPFIQHPLQFVCSLQFETINYTVDKASLNNNS